MPGRLRSKNLQRDTLKIIANTTDNPIKKRIAELGVLYSKESRLVSNYLRKLVNVKEIKPRHLPTQASFRCSTLDPPVTNWPRECINTQCPQTEHEWTDECWSIRDIIGIPKGYVKVVWDHDDIEGRIYNIIVNNEDKLKAYQDKLDLHTITCCKLFNMDLPQDLQNPHSSIVDMDWRKQHQWQGKDTPRRVLAKNFNHGSKYTETYKFVHMINGIEKYGLSYSKAEELAREYIKNEGDSWERKIALMNKIRRDRVSRTLYGGRRQFFTSDPETGRQGFSHMISGTVSHYNYMTLVSFDDLLGDNTWLSHNAHDGDKIFIKKDFVPSKPELLKIIEREVTYEGRSIKLTAGIKVYE